MSGTVIGHDGTAYAWIANADAELMVAARDSSGTLRPGWPFRVTSPGSDPSLVAGADGSLLVGTHDEDRAGFQLHRVGADGREVTGWPYRDDGASYCSDVVAGTDGTTILACAQRDGQSSTIVVIDAAGQVVPGWPVRREGVERLESRVAGYLLARDRVLVGSYIPPDPPEEGLCGAAAQAVLAELDATGRVVPGWPVTAAGWVSRPVIGADGTVYYLAHDRFFARGPDGAVRAGWPVAIPPVYPECADYGPYLAPDGTVYAMGDGVAAFGPDGRARPGWPFEPAHGFAAWFCTMDAAGGTSPVLGPDGRVYAAVVGASDASGEPVTLQIFELDSTGRVMPGWPYTLPGVGRGEVGLLGVVDGRLYVSLQRCGTSDSSTALLALRADGSLSD